jgi:hypothetical protein
VEKLEKLVAKAGSTVQSNRLTFKVGNSLFQNLWRKTPYSLFGICRGWLDLQLSYSKLSQLLFKFFEKISLNSAPAKHLSQGPATRDVVRVLTPQPRAGRPRRPRPRRPSPPPPEAHTSPCAARRGSSESSRGLARRAVPARGSPRTGGLSAAPAVRAPAEGAVLQRASCAVTTSSQE